MNKRADPTTFVALTPTMRELIENIIENLLLLLDELDGDPELEPTMGDVPWGYQDEQEGDNSDAEPDDNGIADHDGLMEQSPEFGPI